MLKAVRSLSNHRRLCHHSLYPGHHRSQLVSVRVAGKERGRGLLYILIRRRLRLLRLSTEMSDVSSTFVIKRHWLLVYSLKPCQTFSFSLSLSYLPTSLCFSPFVFVTLLLKFEELAQTGMLALGGCRPQYTIA